jgi:peptide/nickel transport system ATP-binding protein
MKDTSKQTVLDIQNLSIEFPIYQGAVRAVNGVSIHIERGEVVGIVGESGSAKSVTAMMAMRLLPEGRFKVTSGSVTLLGRDVVAAHEQDMLAIRGRDVCMVFQEPLTALNPTQRIERQMLEVIRLHRACSKQEARALAIRLLGEMRIADPEQVLQRYPFELSGGMRQRILIALAFSCDPKIIIADEPTTALDVTVQRQVLQLMRAKARDPGTAILFISHDLALVSQFCDRVYVMYAGSVVEDGPTAEVLGTPMHPYTRALLRALPECAQPGELLQSIPGTVPNLSQPLIGCSFAPRCTHAQAKCSNKPPLQSVASHHRTACWFAKENL